MNQSHYETRNKNLKTLGFRSYEEYLHCGIWKWIRRKVFRRAKGVCESCRINKACAVHHESYSIKVLLGQRNHQLVAVCAMCHEMAHEHDNEPKKIHPQILPVITDADNNKALEWFNRL